MIIIWIIVAIIIFSLIILIHEFGHFYAARKFWVKVEEFGLWIPPKAKTLFIDKEWTNYTLNWLPLWWFVRLNWENSSSKPSSLQEKEQEQDKTKFSDKTYIQKSIILLAWIFMNFLLAWIIFSVLFIIWIKPIWINDKIPTNLNSKIIPTYSGAINDWILIKNDWLILSPIKWSIAEKAWIKYWDILIKSPYPPSGTFHQGEKENLINAEKVIEIISKNPWNKLIFEIKRENKIINILIIPSPLGEGLGRGKIWAYIWENIILNENFKYKYSLLNSIKYWFTETYIQSVLTVKWIGILTKKIFSPEKPKDRTEALEQMSWPIWIVDFVSHSVWEWIIFLSIITAIISINLWVFNLLPIPALDWWRFFLLTINTFISKISKEKINLVIFENAIHILFFIILIALSLVIWYNDIDKIINR